MHVCSVLSLCVYFFNLCACLCAMCEYVYACVTCIYVHVEARRVAPGLAVVSHPMWVVVSEHEFPERVANH